MSDGNLRMFFRNKIPDAFWTSIESGSTAGGIPDSHFVFPNGISGWVEFKQTMTNRIKFDKKKFQIAFAERYTRYGGTSFVAVRQHWPATRIKKGMDRLYLIHGKHARKLDQEGLMYTPWIGHWDGGPARWKWNEVRNGLIGRLT